MKKPLHVIILASFLLLGACEKHEPGYSERFSANVIEPLYTDLSVNLAALAQRSEDFCLDTKLDASELGQIQQLWFQAASSWQQAQVIHFGPIEENHRRWHFQFWPDENDITGKVMHKLLNSDETMTPGMINQHGVTAQGFMALEYLLFDENNPVASFSTPATGAKQRCLHLVYVSEALSNMASELQLQWLENGAYRELFDKPGPDNPFYKDQADIHKAVIASVVKSLTALQQEKLGRPLGFGGTSAEINITLAEAWRSQLSESFLQSHMQGIALMLNASNAGIMTELDDQHLDLIKTLVSQLKSTEKSLQQLKPLSEAINNSASLKQSEQAWQALDALITSCKHQLTAAFDVVLGFDQKPI